MKKFWKYLAAAAVIMSVTPLMSCDNDDDYSSSPGRPDYSKNRVYMLSPDDDYATLEYKVTGEFINSFENPLTLTQIRCTRPAPENVTVIAEIDPSLVDEYNQANGTDYEMMGSAKLVNTTYEIPRGEFLATEKLAIDLTDRSALEGSEKDLILPIAIKSVTGGLVISKTSRLFIVFDYKANELTPTVTSTIDVDVNQSGWQSAYTNYIITDFINADWNLDNAVTITATIDNSLVDIYNAANGTDCKPLNATVQPITIAKEGLNANLSLRLGDYTAVQDGVEYIVPLRLAITSGAGAVLATDAVYVIVRKEPLIMSYMGSSRPSGWTQIMYSADLGMTCTLEQKGEAYDLTEILISSAGGSYIFPSDKVTFDLGSSRSIKGMALQFVAWYYACGSITNIEISTDGTTWKPVEGASNSAGARIPYFGFNKPQQMRYLRFTPGANYQDGYNSYIEFAAFYY